MINRFVYYNPNPKKRTHKNGKPYAWTRCDCSVRAIACALNISWEDAYMKLCAAGNIIYDMPDTKEAIDYVLCNNGFEYVKFKRPARGSKRDTVYDIAQSLKSDIVANCTGHVVCIKNGKYYDTSDSGDMCVFSYWKKKD